LNSAQLPGIIMISVRISPSLPYTGPSNNYSFIAQVTNEPFTDK